MDARVNKVFVTALPPSDHEYVTCPWSLNLINHFSVVLPFCLSTEERGYKAVWITLDLPGMAW